MKVYIGADHRGYEFKGKVKDWLLSEEIEVEDVGAYELDPDDDYVDFAVKVARQVEGDAQGSYGVLFCGSGHGMDIVANRFSGIRAIIGYNKDVVVQGREHEDANVMVVPSDWLFEGEVIEWVRTFLMAEFLREPRNKRRLEKLSELRVSDK